MLLALGYLLAPSSNGTQQGKANGKSHITILDQSERLLTVVPTKRLLTLTAVFFMWPLNIPNRKSSARQIIEKVASFVKASFGVNILLPLMLAAS